MVISLPLSLSLSLSHTHTHTHTLSLSLSLSLSHKKPFYVRQENVIQNLRFSTLPRSIAGGPHGVMVKAMDCEIVVSEFELQSLYYVHFRANTLGNGMNPLSS